MNALVTGATGFVGGALVDRLLRQKWHVAALARRGSKHTSLKRKGVKIIFGDLADLASVKKAVKGVDIVFNSAAALPYHNLPDQDYWEVNVTGVANVIDAAKTSGVKRVVHISTVGIYGRTQDVYSRTKLEGEKIVAKFMKDGFSAVIIRPTIAYGPGDTRPGFLNLFTLIKKGMFIPVGRGDNFFHTIFIENLVDALWLIASKKESLGEDFIIGDDPCPTMREIIGIIAEVQGRRIPNFYLPKPIAYSVGLIFDLFKHLGLPAPLTTRRVNFITENKKFKIDKAKRVLGYKPKVGLEEGMQKTFNWYKDRGYL